MKLASPLSHIAYITDFSFELPWPEQRRSRVASRHNSFIASAQGLDEFELLATDERAPAVNAAYRVHLPFWPGGDATALVRLGLLGDAATYGIAVELDMEHCWLDDVEFLVDALVAIVGSDLAVMRSKAKITRLGTTLDIFCCHMKRLGLTGADGMVKLLNGRMARFAPATIARAGLVPGAITVAQVNNLDAPIVRIRTLQDLRLPVAELGALPSPLTRLKFNSLNPQIARADERPDFENGWQWEPVKYWEDLLWNLHYTTIFNATDCNLKPVWFA